MIDFSPSYNRDLEKILKKRYLQKSKVDETIEIFKKDQADYRLRPHKINCKHDKNRRSISIDDTGYRILYTTIKDRITFVRILDHDDYDRINKGC